MNPNSWFTNCVCVRPLAPERHRPRAARAAEHPLGAFSAPAMAERMAALAEVPSGEIVEAVRAMQKAIYGVDAGSTSSTSETMPCSAQPIA